MSVKLTAAEREYLLEILRDSMGTLHEQIYHSTTSTFTDMLKQKEKLLGEVIRKVDADGEFAMHVAEAGVETSFRPFDQ